MEATLKTKQGELPVSELPLHDLQWYATECKNAAKQAIAQAELARRGEGGDAPAAQPRQARSIEQRAPRPLGEAIHDPQRVTEALQKLAAQYHLVSPVTQVDVLPPGFGVSMSLVSVDPDPDPYKGPKEVYDVGGRLGLSKTTLDRIAAAASLSWDPALCGRLDDGSDPHYCHYRAVGRVRTFDGSERIVTGEVEMDLRDGSPQVEEIEHKARNARKGPRDPSIQIREFRKFVLRHAESKAKNRAIADMGVKRSYAPAELQKPFAVARLVWTGRSDDPEMQRQLTAITAKRFLGGAAALYGSEPSLPQRAPQRHAPPPVGQVVDSPVDDDEDY